MKSWLILVVLVAISANYAAPPAFGCNIPVYRYALERWSGDDYQLVIYHRGELPPASQQLVSKIQDSLSVKTRGKARIKSLNLQIVDIDVDHQSDATQPFMEAWSEIAKDGQSLNEPYAVLLTGNIQNRRIKLWQGSLDAFSWSSWADSPARQELRKRLLAGDAMVWVVLKSSNAAQNAAVAALLKSVNQRLASDLELPDGIGLPGSELYSDVPLLLQFSVLEVDRQSDAESYLHQLCKSCDGEAFASDEPMIVPVFGRGRALEIIPASRFDADLASELGLFLSGACSCQVKERNPGFDLLLNQDWEAALFKDGIPPPPDDTGLGQNKGPVLRPIPTGKR